MATTNAMLKDLETDKGQTNEKDYRVPELSAPSWLDHLCRSEEI
jgi:hypothetical protein